MRRVFALCLVACGSPSSEPPSKSAGPPATAPPFDVSDPVALDAAAVSDLGEPLASGRDTPMPRRLWPARHGAPIQAVFGSEDGDAAVSVDAGGHVRLWPALDGTREPLALPLKQPDEVAIVREGDVLSVAARDPSGGLEVLVVDGEGRLARHVRRPPEPGVAAIVPHDGGFLVLHRDQMLELLDARGARRALLPAPPGEHVLRLVARNGRTLALVRATDGVRGRWIASDALAWGEHTAKLRDDFDSVFLSPDHAYLLAVRDVPDRPIVVMHHPFAVPELHGRGVAQPATVRSRLVELATGRVRGFAPERFGDERSYEPVGFWGDGQIVIAIGDFDAGMLEWRTLGGRRDAIIGEAPGYAVDLVSVAAATVTDDAVIAFTSDQLVVVERTGPGASPRARFLGYRAARAKGVRGAPAGAVARLGSSAIVLDEELDAKRRLPSPQAIPLADDLALVQFLPRRSTPEPAIDPAWIEGAPSRPRVSVVQPRLALYDLDEDKELQRWPVARAFHYEPSTRLLAIERAGKVELATFDPAARKFSASRTFVVPVTRVALLDPTQRPAQTTAALAMFVRVRGKTSEMYAITDLDGPLPEPVTIDGVVEAVDRAGRLYVRESTDTIAIRDGDRPPVRLGNLAGWTVRPSRTGAHVAVFARARLALFDAAGTELWSVGFPGISDVAWTADGELLVLAGDIAKIDVATGEVVGARCGWELVVRSRPPRFPDSSSEGSTTCDR